MLPARRSRNIRQDLRARGRFAAVLGVRLGSAGHFIAVLEMQDDQISYVGPMRGAHRCTTAEFRSRHDFTGFHLVIQWPDTESN
jgi:hypothetical protein